MSGMSHDVTLISGMSPDLTEMPGMSNDVGEECYMTVMTSWQVCQ